MKIIKDKDNLCLKCKYSIGIDYNQKIQWKGYEYTRCDCELMYYKNAGHRKTCKRFDPKYKIKCPFCGGEVHIVVCDDEGNIHRENGYERNPWSGLGYVLTHKQEDVPNNKYCPIATYADDDFLGAQIYDTRAEAFKVWENNKIARLTAENAELHARLEKAVILPCVDKEDWYYTIKFPARVEDEIFIINKETNSILSAAVNNIVSYDESGKEWIFSIRYDCEGCDKYGECDYFDCPSKNCIWGDMDIPHGDNEYVVGYTGVNLSEYNKTWFTDRAKAEARLTELKGGNSDE